MKKFTLLLFVLSLLAVFCAFSATAENEVSGSLSSGLTWTLDSEGTLTISGSGYIDSFSWNSVSPGHYMTPWYDQRDCIKNLVIEEGVTGIGTGAFYQCSKLTGVSLPNTLTAIGSMSFYGCASLRGLTIPGTVSFIGNNAFNSTSLRTVAIPSGITSISSRAFYNCSSLVSVSIPKSVTTIEWGAFDYCDSLKTVYYQGSDSQWRSVNIVTKLSSNDYNGDSNKPVRIASKIYGCIFQDDAVYAKIYSYSTNLALIRSMSTGAAFSIPATVEDQPVTKLSDYAFSGCLHLEEITVPDSINTLGTGIFYGCNNLRSVRILGGIKSIPEFTFYCCGSLESVEFSGTISSIGESAFYHCSSLLSYENLKHVSSFRKNAFSGCSSLSGELTLENVSTIEESAFSGCSSLTALSIQNNKLNRIGASAFSGCIGLTEVTLPKSLTGYGNNAFADCEGLMRVSISDIETWCKSAFENASANPLSYAHDLYLNGELLTELVIPDTVYSIGNYVFFGCSSLTKLTIPCTKENLESEIPYYNGLNSIGNYAFYGCSGLTELELPESLTTIGAYAFCGCSGLSELNIRYEKIVIDGNYTYYSGINSLENGAFMNCVSLTELVIPESVSTIGSNVLSGCSSLKILTMPFRGNGSAVSSFSYYFNTIPESLENVTILNGSVGTAFRGCSGLKSITLCDPVTSIGNGIFAGCNSLESLTVPRLSVGGTFNGSTFDDTMPLSCYFSASPADDLTEVTVIYYSAPGVVMDKITRYVPNSLRSVTVTKGEIGYGAFWGCSMLREIHIPEDAESIGYYAFYGCSLLPEFKIPEGVHVIRDRTFEGCTTLKKVSIPDGITSVGASAFQNCVSLRSVFLPENVTSIGQYAFSNCASLYCLVLPATLTTVADSAFYNAGVKEVIYAGNVSMWNAISIGKNNEALTAANRHLCFHRDGDWISCQKPDSSVWILQYCGDEASTEVPTALNDQRVSVIGNYAFYSCEQLAEIYVPSGIREISHNAFTDSPSLQEIRVDRDNPVYSDDGGVLYDKAQTKVIKCPEGKTGNYSIPVGVETISESAFAGSHLEALSIPAGVTTLKRGSFDKCALKKISFPVTLTWPVEAFPSSIEEMTITGAGEIGSWPQATHFTTATYKAPWHMAYQSLRKVEIQEGVTAIGIMAFQGLPVLEEVVLPNTLTKIGNYAFYEDHALRTVNLPESLRTIGNYAFCRCRALESVLIPTRLEQLGAFAFKGCSTLTSASVPGVFSDIDGVFYGCSNLQELIISNGPSSIKDTEHSSSIHEGDAEQPGAFAGCENLKTIYLPRSIKSISAYSFFFCESLEDVYYSGSQNEWDTVLIGEGNEPLTTANVHYGQNAMGKVYAEISSIQAVQEGDQTVYQIGIWCRSNTTACAYGARYSLDGRFLGCTVLPLTQGKETFLILSAEEGTRLRIMVASDTVVPLTIPVNLS